MKDDRFEEAPQYSHGCDWSAPGRILARGKGMQLVWRPGRKFFGGIGYRTYTPPDMDILFDGEHAGNKRVEVVDNYKNRSAGRKIERLSKYTILRHRGVIEEHFGKDAAFRIAALKKTEVFQ